MNATDNAGQLRCTIVAFTTCDDARTFGRSVWMNDEETARLQGLLATLEDWGLALRAAIEPAVPSDGYEHVVAHLNGSVGAHVVHAALAAARSGPFPGSDPRPGAVMPVWPFEPGRDGEDVLLSSARLWGVDLLLEALRVEGEDDPEPVAAVRERFARWATASGGSRRLATVRLPRHAGSYAVFASPATA